MTDSSPKTKADLIAQKHGFVDGVATPAYLIGFDRADALCSRKHGWQKGRGGKCERVKTKNQNKASLAQNIVQAPQGRSNRAVIAVGATALALGATGGAIGGVLIGSAQAEQINEQVREASEEKHAEARDAMLRVKEEQLAAERSKFIEEREAVDAEFQKTQEELENTKQAFAKTSKDLKDIQGEKATLDKEKKTLSNELKQANKKLNDLEQKVSQTEDEKVQNGLLSEQVQKLDDQLRQKTKMADEAAQKLAEKESEVAGLRDSLKATEAKAKAEQKQYKELSSAIDGRTKDVKKLTKKVADLKKAETNSKKLRSELSASKEKISELEKNGSALTKTISTLESSIGTLEKERTALGRELINARQSANAGTAEAQQRIERLQSEMNESARSLSKMREGKAKAEDNLRKTSSELESSLKKVNAAEGKIAEANKKVIALEKELDVSREAAATEIAQIQKKAKEEIAAVYEEQAKILEQSPESFSRSKARRSSKAGIRNVLSYSLDKGIIELDDANGSFWNAKLTDRVEASGKAISRMIDLEREALEAKISGVMSKKAKDTTLAMSSPVFPEERAGNFRKEKKKLADLAKMAEEISFPHTTASGTIVDGVDVPVKTAWNYLATSWKPSEEDSPTMQLIDNEAIIAEAKIRDVFTFREMNGIKKEAQNKFSEILLGEAPMEQKIKELKKAQKDMQEQVKDIQKLATGDLEKLFSSIQSKNRTDSKGNRCWKGYEPVPGVKAFEKGSCRPIGGKKKKTKKEDATDKGRSMADEKIAKVMGEFKDGKLKSSSGDPVKKRKQAMAIALSEAGVSK